MHGLCRAGGKDHLLRAPGAGAVSALVETTKFHFSEPTSVAEHPGGQSHSGLLRGEDGRHSSDHPALSIALCDGDQVLPALFHACGSAALEDQWQ